ncbi:DNA-binding IclR family transcriptional regulator [Compostimonas suwonensis]|uniref:DNA-binding IclR family transcriptional regulator n=1 Tax=Compostimonas suwonensis TaxID=1048394 RepID=A0A2M9BU84_9MICO|nr:DNA-binding IclR family transcriptional regulator [Compostimonas suwonensis]
MESDRLKRITDVLGLLAVSGPKTVTEISSILALPVSSTHDLLTAMARGGVATVTSRGYDVGPVAARLAFKIWQRMDVAKVATPELERLVRRVGFDVYLAVQTGNEVIYASRFRGRQGVNIDIPLGLPLYRHATAAGKLFAAYSKEIRKEVINSELPKLTPRTRTDKAALNKEFDAILGRGLSISREEAVTGIIGLAAPILRDEHIIGAAHISVLRSRLDDEGLREVGGELIATVAAIEERLQGRPPQQRPHEPITEADVAPLVSGSVIPRV